MLPYIFGALSHQFSGMEDTNWLMRCEISTALVTSFSITLVAEGSNITLVASLHEQCAFPFYLTRNMYTDETLSILNIVNLYA